MQIDFFDAYPHRPLAPDMESLVRGARRIDAAVAFVTRPGIVLLRQYLKSSPPGGAVAQRFGGHGGIDYYCIYDFVKMLCEDKEPWIDVYDAAAWSAITFCSKLSLDRKGARVEMPDLTNGKWKDPNWRKDRMPIA